jgi:peroxiredoxin
VTLVVGQLVPARLADAVVLDARDAPHRLGDLWATRDAVVVFVRHFACAGCSAHVAELRPRLRELADLGVATALVGNGSPLQLAAFVARQELAGHPLELFTDPTRAAYLAAGLERSWLGVVGPRALGNLAALLARGYPNGVPRGDTAQQGGTLYIARGGRLAFYHRAARLGDRARTADVVGVALAARATAAAAAGVSLP